MAQFNGNNNQNLLEQFYERSNFSANAYGESDPGDIYPQPIKDFDFAERVLYGRINKDHDPIFLSSPDLNLAVLKPQRANAPKLQAVNFVADAFYQFILDWQGAAARGRIQQGADYLVDIVPQKAYVNYRAGYKNYKISLRNSFLGSYLTKERRKAIIDFKSFMKVFMKYLLEISTSVVVTPTAYITSRAAGPLISGLCIEVASLDASSDSVKEEFINSPNFEFYKLVARTNGFSIDKQAPWRLVADIASPQMLNYSAQYGQNTESEVLNGYYSRSGGADIVAIQQMAIDFYTALVSQEPIVKTPTSLAHVAKCGERYVRRQRVSSAAVFEQYSLFFWVDNYITIRYNEQRSPLSEGALTEIRKVCNKLLASTNSERACITYINDNIKTFDNFKGSYARRVLDRRNAAENTQTQPTY